jgi:hypothetical protein
MTKSLLLNNFLDVLDRLFDRETEIIDVGAILYATGLAIRPDSLFPLFLDAAASLERIRRAGLTADDARESALQSTNPLRLALAAALEE